MSVIESFFLNLQEWTCWTFILSFHFCFCAFRTYFWVCLLSNDPFSYIYYFDKLRFFLHLSCNLLLWWHVLFKERLLYCWTTNYLKLLTQVYIMQPNSWWPVSLKVFYKKSLLLQYTFCFWNMNLFHKNSSDRPHDHL